MAQKNLTSSLVHSQLTLGFALLTLLALPAQAAEPAVITAGFGINKPPYVIETTSSGLEVELVKAALKAAAWK